MMTEHIRIKGLYDSLTRIKLTLFPKWPKEIQTSDKQGVYIIYKDKETPVHVGRTIRGKNGLRQRLINHMQKKSSFTKNYLEDGQSVRETYLYRCLEIENDRDRCLLEALTCGLICPKYVGLGRNKQ